MKNVTVACIVVAAITAAPTQAQLFKDVQGPYPYQNSLDLAQALPFLGGVSVTFDDGSVVFGSGSLVAPDKVLTAAHAVKRGQSVQSFTFSVGDDIYQSPWETESGTTFEAYPGWNGTGDPGDLAILTLSSPITSVLPTALYDGDFQWGVDSVVVAGFGEPGTVSEGLRPIDGKRRAGIMFPEYPSVSYFETWFYPSGPYSDPLAMLLTHGSSGGFAGVYDALDGRYELFGVPSWIGIDGWWNFPNLNGHQRLDGEFGDWVEARIPEPATVSLMVLGGAMLARRRRRVA